MGIQLKTNQTLLFIGDSITDCDRRNRDVPLGVGYVRMFSDLLSIREPAKHVNVVNRGISGNTVDDLRSRWTDHVLAHRPDQLVVAIGINDINRWLTNPEQQTKQSPEQYAAIYDQIIDITRKELPETRILLASPFYASLEANPDAYRYRFLTNLPSYIQVVEETAARHSAQFVDLHAAVQKLLAQGFLPDTFAEDAVHLTPPGALFIAEQIYAALS
jgi:lysophospholipase L1-like esterase